MHGLRVAPAAHAALGSHWQRCCLFRCLDTCCSMLLHPYYNVALLRACDLLPLMCEQPDCERELTAGCADAAWRVRRAEEADHHGCACLAGHCMLPCRSAKDGCCSHLTILHTALLNDISICLRIRSGSCHEACLRGTCSAGELIVGPKRMYFMDEISTGLVRGCPRRHPVLHAP